MYNIANEEAANGEMAYQNEFLSIFIDGLSDWEDFCESRTLQDVANAFAEASMEHELLPDDCLKQFKAFCTNRNGLLALVREKEYLKRELGALKRSLNQALNSGDGSYRP